MTYLRTRIFVSEEDDLHAYLSACPIFSTMKSFSSITLEIRHLQSNELFSRATIG